MAMLCSKCLKPMIWVLYENGDPHYMKFDCKCKGGILISFPHWIDQEKIHEIPPSQ